MSTEVKETKTVAEDAFNIFNTNVEDMTSYEEESQYEKKDYSKIFFEPDPKAAGKELSFVIKFCPNIYNPKDNIPKRYTYKIPVPERPDKNFTWVSPSSVGLPCPVVSAYFDFKDSADPKLQKIAAGLKRKRNRAAVIQILNAPSDPSLNGQFRLFRFAEGREIDNMIQKMMKPSEDDIAIGVQPVNVFDPFESPIMILRVNQGEYGRDFTASTWAGSDRNQGITLYEYDENGLAIDPKNKRVVLHASDRGNVEYQKRIIELLKMDHINMKENWMFNEPDAEYLRKCERSIELMRTGKVSEISTVEAEDHAGETLDKPAEKPAEKPAATITYQTVKPVAVKPAAKPAATPTVDAAKEKAIDELFD